MNGSHPQGLSSDDVAELEAWAEAGDFVGVSAGHALVGDEARSAGRALLAAAGIDVDALDHERLSTASSEEAAAQPVNPGPEWHVQAPGPLDRAARERAAREGKDLSTFVRDVVDQYLAAS